MKKNFSILNMLIILFVMLNIISCFSMFFLLGKNFHYNSVSSLINTSAKLKVEVLDEATLAPIDNATVCIIESRHYENTNKYGTTSYINVPVIRNTNYDLSNIRNWGELTILVYKNGYSDNLSFYNMVMPGTTKVGLVIKLRPIVNQEDLGPTISVEHPDQGWCENLIKLYKKRS